MVEDGGGLERETVYIYSISFCSFYARFAMRKVVVQHVYKLQDWKTSPLSLYSPLLCVSLFALIFNALTHYEPLIISIVFLYIKIPARDENTHD